AWPLAARAQQPDRIRRIAVLAPLAEDDPEMTARLAGFRRGLEKRGWSEGRNVRMDTRFAPDSSADQAQVQAKELIALQPDVILAQATPLVTALQRESRLIPIVFASVADPIGSGFVASLPRPGGNITGVMLYEASVIGKWLAMLKEIAPRLERVALLINPKTAPYYSYYLRAAESLSSPLGIKLVPSLVENSADLERTIGAFARTPNGGLLLPPDISTQVHRDLIIALAARYSLPAVYWDRLFVAAGGLMSYGADYVDMFRQGGGSVGRLPPRAQPPPPPAPGAAQVQTSGNPQTTQHRRP